MLLKVPCGKKVDGEDEATNQQQRALEHSNTLLQEHAAASLAAEMYCKCRRTCVRPKAFRERGVLRGLARLVVVCWLCLALVWRNLKYHHTRD